MFSHEDYKPPKDAHYFGHSEKMFLPVIVGGIFLGFAWFPWTKRIRRPQGGFVDEISNIIYCFVTCKFLFK